MADPLSLAASIAGLVSLADIAFKYAYKFVRAAKDAKDDILSLADEINNLASVLRVLGALASDLEAEGDQFDPTLRNHYLNHCFKTLTRIETRVKKAADSFARSKLEGIYRQLKWPFSSSETKDLLAELSRHKKTINVALAADSMRKLQLSLSKSDELGKQVSAIGEVVRRIEINTLIDVNDRKQRVLDYFMKRNPQSNLETSIKLRHSMTGLWLTESPTFVRWLETPSSKLWLTGIPGAGKTVLAGSAIQEALSRSYSAQGIAVAFFFCDYKNPTTWQAVNILGAIVSQLARQKNEAFDILNRYHEDLNPPRGLPQTPDPDELRAQINRISELFDQTIIITDGLDECGDSADDVLDILIQSAEYSEEISLAIFSRDHFNIRVRLELDFEIIPIAARTNDIQLYVNAEVDKRVRTRRLQLTDADMREEIQETLVKRADGMFRWVVCQIDYLCDCAHDEERREALNELPPDLPESYRRLLERVNRCSPRVQDMVKMCLHFMTVTEPRLTIHELRQAVSTPSTPRETLSESNTVSEQEITRRCSSLIRKSQDGRYFEFAHFSVQEFLENRSAVSHSAGLEKYWVSPSTTRSMLAAQCLRFLQLENFNKLTSDLEHQVIFTRERDEDYPFYNHAAVSWIKLTEHGIDDSKVLGLAKSLFRPSKHACFVSWAIEVLDQVILDSGSLYKFREGQKPDHHAWKIATLPSFRPLHMAAALNLPEICRSLIQEGSSASQVFSAASPLDLAFATILAIPGMAWTSVEHNVVSTIRHQFLPSAERRNTTIDCLMESGATLSGQLYSADENSVFSITCIFAAVFNDLSPITKILSCNISLSSSEFETLKDWMNTMDVLDSRVESCCRAILRSFNSTEVSRTDWGKKIGSFILNWALRKNLVLEKDQQVVESGVSTIEDCLVTQLFQAISSDDVDLVKHYLADGVLDNLASHSIYCHTLLHFAAESSAAGIFKFLIAEGYDPYVEDYSGDLPIHLCGRRHDSRLFHVFKDLDISLLSQNRRGYNIWHLWADDHPFDYRFIKDMFELDPEAMCRGLQMKAPQGDTPLTLLFKKLGHENGTEDRNIDLGRLCSCLSSFWPDHTQVSSKATHWETRQVAWNPTRMTPEVGLMIKTEPAPLYNIGPWASLENVQFLVRLYPHAIDCRFEGRLPVESYITEAILRCESPKEEIIEVLLPQNLSESPLCAGQTLWSFVCRLSSQLNDVETCLETTYRPDHNQLKLIYAVTMTMLRFGVMKAHEKQLRESGLVPLLAEFRASHDPVHDPDNDSCPSMRLIRDVSVQTESWAELKDSDCVSRLFKFAICCKDREMIRILLRNRVSLHHRTCGYSPIEIAFHAPVALRMCNSEEGIALFKELLDQSISDELIGISPVDNKSSLLHMLATRSDVTSILWLADSLFQRGIDIHQVGSGDKAESALGHHIRKSSFQFAELLMKRGAVHLSTDNKSLLKAVRSVIRHDNVDFLRIMSAHIASTSAMGVWASPVMTFSIKAHSQSIQVTQGNAIHLASAHDSLKCLRFILDEGSKWPEASISSEGVTPLHISAFRGFVEASRLLLTHNFSSMAQSKLGETPLHMAVQGRSLPAVKCLLEHGASDSFDTFGMTSQMIASEGNYSRIFRVLRRAAKHRKQSRQSIQEGCLSGHQINRYCEALGRAVLSADYENLELLSETVGSINMPLRQYAGHSVLTLALKQQKPKVAEWLLDHGASVLTARHLSGYGENAIEIASTKTSFNFLLPKLLRCYYQQGGNLSCGDDFPFHDAIWNGNTAGLEILISVTDECIKLYRATDKLFSHETVGKILSRQSVSVFDPEGWWQSGRHYEGTTPVHIASWRGNKSAVSLLVEKGADINATDANGWTPLIYTRSYEMAEYLISLGASPSAILRYGHPTALIRRFGTWSFYELYTSLFLWQPVEHFPTTPLKQRPTMCEGIWVTPECLKMLYESWYNLTTEDGTGRSLMHIIICEHDLSDLVLNSYQRLDGTGPFPWHLEWRPFPSLAFITSAFKRFREKVPFDTFRAVLNLEPSRGWSPLCRAASLNLVDIVANCIEMGADIDFEGCSLGSAVMIASACGSLNALKFLVRAGASLSYGHGYSRRCCYLLAGTEDVRACLLSGWFWDQTTITDRQEPGYMGKEGFWSGYIQGKLKLYGKRAREPTESTLDYAKRLAKLKKGWQGKILPVYIEDPELDMIAQEPESKLGLGVKVRAGI